MTQPTPIVASVDFSPGSRGALQHAVRLSRDRGVPLHVLHVIDRDVLSDMASMLGQSMQHLEAESRKNLNEKLRAWISDVGGVPNSIPNVQVGPIGHSILDCVESLGAQLLVMGVRGEGQHAIGAGSVALRCLRKAPCDVLLVHDQTPPTFARILTGIDLSGATPEVLAKSYELARSHSAALTVLHAYHGPWNRVHYLSPTTQVAERYRTEFVMVLKSKFEAALLAQNPKGIKLQSELVEAFSHGQALIDYATKIKSDLIVLGTRGRSAIVGTLLGSTTDRVARALPCALYAVRPR